MLRLCAAAIEGIRTYLGKDWEKLGAPADERDMRFREARELAKDVIRVAGESADYHRTVDFITLTAAQSNGANCIQGITAL